MRIVVSWGCSFLLQGYPAGQRPLGRSTSFCPRVPFWHSSFLRRGVCSLSPPAAQRGSSCPHYTIPRKKMPPQKRRFCGGKYIFIFPHPFPNISKMLGFCGGKIQKTGGKTALSTPKSGKSPRHRPASAKRSRSFYIVYHPGCGLPQDASGFCITGPAAAGTPTVCGLPPSWRCERTPAPMSDSRQAPAGGTPPRGSRTPGSPAPVRWSPPSHCGQTP